MDTTRSSRRDEDDAAARADGLALLDASVMYEGFLVPRLKGRLWQRPLAPHVGPTIALVARQRRFLRAAYALADQRLSLEAQAVLRSQFDFLVCQEWLALHPERNFALLVNHDQRWKETWKQEVLAVVPEIEQRATARLTDKQRDEAAHFEASLPLVLEDVERAIGDESSQLPRIRKRAGETGLDFLYVVIYKPASHLSHPSIYAIDTLSETTPDGLRVTAAPPPLREPSDIYVSGALLLREALAHAGRQWSRLQIDEVDTIGARLIGIQGRRLDATMPGWRKDFGLEDV